MKNTIVNKVSQSGLITIDLEEYYPIGERVLFDIKDLLFQGLILREKEFREFINNKNWNEYQDKFVAIICSVDAIVPTWAYMLLAVKLESVAKKVIFGDIETLETILFHEQISKIKTEEFRNARIVIKGCGKIKVPKSAYVEITTILRPLAKSIMYGEPCSTVPIYKKQ